MSNPLVTNFTVGPSRHYHGVVDFLAEQLRAGLGEVSHRSPEFTEMSRETIAALRDFFEIPEDYRVFYTSSATEGMEIFLRGGVEEKSCHLVNGNFGNLWAKQAKRTLKKAQVITGDGGKRVDPEKFELHGDADFLCVTANETSTGIAYTPGEIGQIRNRFPHILLGVDVTSVMGAVQYDLQNADGWLFSVQKAFGLPAGLGLVVVSPRLFAKAEEREGAGSDIGCHNSLIGLEKKMAGKFQTPTTPNALDIAGVGFVAKELKARFSSLERLTDFTLRKAEKIYHFFEKHPGLTPAVDVGRSSTTIVINGSEEELAKLHETLAKADIVVGRGYGPMKPKQIRIANFPVHDEQDIENLLKHISV